MAADPFPTGTKTIFCTSTAPTGWTKDSTYNDYAIRVTSGTPSTGGTLAFSTCFANSNWNGTMSADTGATGSYTLTGADLPVHNHRQAISYSNPRYASNSPTAKPAFPGFATYPLIATVTTTTGGGGAHSHPLSGMTGFVGDSVAMDIKYTDVILATRN